MLRHAELGIEGVRALGIHHGTTVVGIEVVGEGRFQVGITVTDIQRVVVTQHTGYHVRDAGLSRIAVVAEVELLLPAEHVAEVDVGRSIHHGA